MVWANKQSWIFIFGDTLALEYFLSSKRPIRIRLTCSYVNKSGRVDRPLFIPIKPMLFYGKQFLTLTLRNFSSEILQFLAYLNRHALPIIYLDIYVERNDPDSYICPQLYGIYISPSPNKIMLRFIPFELYLF